MLNKRVRVRATFTTSIGDYYSNVRECIKRLEGTMTFYEGTKEDKKLYLTRGVATYKFWKRLNVETGGHSYSMDKADRDKPDEDVWIEFNCKKSTFDKELKVNYLFDNVEIIGGEKRCPFVYSRHRMLFGRE